MIYLSVRLETKYESESHFRALEIACSFSDHVPENFQLMPLFKRMRNRAKNSRTFSRGSEIPTLMAAIFREDENTKLAKICFSEKLRSTSKPSSK